jgi:hypothetical protein
MQEMGAIQAVEPDYRQRLGLQAAQQNTDAGA